MKQGDTSFSKSVEVLQEPRGSFVACFILVLLIKCARGSISVNDCQTYSEGDLPIIDIRFRSLLKSKRARTW